MNQRDVYAGGSDPSARLARAATEGLPPRNTGPTRNPSAARLAAHAMGTRFELLLAGGAESRLRAAGEEAIEIILEQHRRLSAFDRGSLLTRINTLAHQRPVPIDPELLDLLTLCREVWHASEGAFDPTIGPLMRAWGFRGGEPSDGSQLAEAKADCGYQHVILDERQSTIAFARPGLELDLGSIAKGFALDLAAERLRELGVPSALLHGGTSSIIAIGHQSQDQPWQIAVGGGGPVAPLVDAALGVSAPHGRQIEHGGRALGHVLDPRTGRPASGARQAAVVADSAALADAWSTALLVRRSAPTDFAHAAAIQNESGDWSFTSRWPTAKDPPPPTPHYGGSPCRSTGETF